MASGPITSWQIDGESVETMSDFIFLGSKITADGDCSHEIKRCLLLGRKVMTNLGSILKSRDITLPTKVRLVKAMVSPVVMYGCESWTVKKAECWKIDAFELWCWRRLLRVPWAARRSNQSILKEISPGRSLEGLMLKSKLQFQLATSCEELTHWKRPWCWEGLGTGGEGDDRGWDGWMASPTRWTWVWVNFGSWCWTGRPGVLRFMGSQRVRHDWETELNWKKGQFLGKIRCCTRLKESMNRECSPPPYRALDCLPKLYLFQFHGQRSLVGNSPWGCKRVGHDWGTKAFHLIYPGWETGGVGEITSE